MFEFHSELPDPQVEKREALIELLSRPDTPELRRGYYYTLEGRPDRFQMIPQLASAFIQSHLLAREERAEWEFMEAKTSAAVPERPWPIPEGLIEVINRVVRWRTSRLQATH